MSSPERREERPAEAAERLATIEERLAELEKSGGKDSWDRLQIITSALVPVALALAGYYFSDALADAQTASEERRDDAARALTEASMHISQGQLVATFMKSLLSADTAERELAIRAVLLALPEAGPQLVDAIRVGSTDARTQEVAKAALEQRRTQLVQDLYGGDQAVQQKAADHLVMGFREDPKLVGELARAAQAHQGSEGVYKAAVVVQALTPEQLQANQAKVNSFTQIVRQGDDRSKEIAAKIEQKAAGQ